MCLRCLRFRVSRAYSFVAQIVSSRLNLDNLSRATALHTERLDRD